MKNMQWVPLPNAHDGDGFTQIMEDKDGMALFGAWVLIVQVASKCHPRGTLVRANGHPHESDSLARMTRGNSETFKKAIKILIKIGWIDEIESETPKAQEGAGCTHPTDEEGKEEKEGNACTHLPVIQEVLDFLNAQTDSNYKHSTKKNQDLIRARINEGFGIEDFKIVIEKKVEDWQGTEWEKFLRPQTLFGTKFESYLNQKASKSNEKQEVFSE